MREVYVGGVRCGFFSQDISHYFSRNCGVYSCVDKSGDNVRGGYRSQETSHSFSINCRARVCVDSRYGYRYQISHSSSHNPGSRGRFLVLLFSSCPFEKNVHGGDRGGYRSHTRHSSSHNPFGCGRVWVFYVASLLVVKSVHGDYRGGISDCDVRRVFRSQETRDTSCHNCVEIFDGDYRGVYRSQTIHSSSHNPGDRHRLLGIYVASRPVHKFFTVVKEVILVVMVEEVDSGIKRPATLPFRIMDKVFILIVEVGVCRIPATLSLP